MGSTADSTFASSLSLLETRLLRIEHLLFGSYPPTADSYHESAADTIESLERRFQALLGKVKVYGELIKLCTSIPSDLSSSYLHN